MPTSIPPDLVHIVEASRHQVAQRRSPHSGMAWCCLVLTCYAVFTQPARAQEPVQAEKSGVLLLENNRVVMGRVTRQGETYSVDQPGGVLVVAKNKVLFVGADMHSVYVHLQDALPKTPAADDHVELARWCISYRMLPEARFELQAALEVDPSRDDIRRNLNQLDSLLKRPVTTESKPVKSEPPAQRMARAAGMATTDVESLGGLSREAGQEFTRHIQPILMHNCTASACHGPKSDQTFKLNLVFQGSTPLRSTTDKNLLALLNYIDRDDPKSGKLWKLLKTNHGAKGSSIFLGSKGKEQLTAFQDWLLSLEEKGDDKRQTATTRAKPTVTKTVAKTNQPSESPPRYRKGEHTRTAVPAKLDEEPAPEELVVASKTESSTKPRTAPKPNAIPPGPPDTEPIVSKNPPKLPDDIVEDPFNPDEFNTQQRVKRGFGSP